MSDNTIVIVSAKRTPTGSFQGDLGCKKAPELAGAVIHDILTQTGLSLNSVDETVIGCVLGAGIGQAPARQAALSGGLPQGVQAITINKVCGSGLQSIMIAHDHIKAGTVEIAVAGGMESMSNAPYLMPGARKGYRMGSKEIWDHMIHDGLEDAYSGNSMGLYGEATAEKYGFTREEQDAFAIESAKRALAAQKMGFFDEELTHITREDGTEITQDEPPTKVKLDKISQLKPAFKKDGTLTAANSSSISDGAAGVLLMTAVKAQALGLKPMARIVGHASFSHAPEWFTTAPVGAIKKLYASTGWSSKDVDLYEINEAFAVVTMATMKELDLPHDRVNIQGGACALGHPIGASGARILVTLLHSLKRTKGKRGIASLCIGGGEAVAMAVETL